MVKDIALLTHLRCRGSPGGPSVSLTPSPSALAKTRLSPAARANKDKTSRDGASRSNSFRDTLIGAQVDTTPRDTTLCDRYSPPTGGATALGKKGRSLTHLGLGNRVAIDNNFRIRYQNVWVLLRSEEQRVPPQQEPSYLLGVSWATVASAGPRYRLQVFGHFSGLLRLLVPLLLMASTIWFAVRCHGAHRGLIGAGHSDPHTVAIQRNYRLLRQCPEPDRPC